MAEIQLCDRTVLEKKTQEKGKSKQFRWESDMIENLVTFLQQYKTQMEYKNIDFDGDRPAQYSWLREEMSKLYHENTSLFGPVSLTPAKDLLSNMSKEEIKAYTKQHKAENELIKKGYTRIREKVKEIRQSFSQAVVNGKRSGSGKIVYEFYDKLITIWGGSAAIKPLAFGVGTDSLTKPDCPQNAQIELEQVFDDDENREVVTTVDEEKDEVSDEESMHNRKRKSASQVPKLIDNKRKHLGKTLSAAQRDAILLNEAKEDSKFRKNLADATRDATASFSEALKDVSTCMTQVGNGLSRSIELMAQAVMAQMMNYSQAHMPLNQNHFYQGVPNAYPTFQQSTAHGIQPQPSSTHPNLDQQNYTSNESHGAGNLYHPL